MRLATVGLIAITFLISCSNKELREIKYPNGQLQSKGYAAKDKSNNYVLIGKWTYWYNTGQKKAEGNYKENDSNAVESGKRSDTGILLDGMEGPWSFWYENGQLKMEEKFVNGLPEGPVTMWRDNGKKWSEGNFKNGKLEGRVVDYYENGQIEKDRQFINNQINGLTICYHPNGTKWTEGTYKDGQLIGPEKEWDESGAIVIPQISTAAFKASLPQAPQRFRCTAKLDSYYNYMFRGTGDMNYSIKINIGPDNYSDIYGYIEKSSPDGQALFATLNDGNTHPVQLELAYLNGDTGNGQVCKIFKFYR